MTDCSYCVVVEKIGRDIRISTLFSGTGCRLTDIKASECDDVLHVGDIVQTRTQYKQMYICLWHRFPDSVWSDGQRVIVRTIVSYSDEVPADSGPWKDDTGRPYVLLVSRDIGIIAVPSEWYTNEFHIAKQSHRYAFVEFSARSLTSTLIGRRLYYWTIMDDRISLPATPSSIEDPAQFLMPYELRAVPALILPGQGNSTFMWSYALGDHLCIKLMEPDQPPGTWLKVTVIRSSPNSASHGCRYTVLKSELVEEYSQPVISVVRDTIQMTLRINRSDPGNPYAKMMLWIDHWGLSIDYDDEYNDWIRGENRLFIAEIQIRLSAEEGLPDRRAIIKAVCPPGMPRPVPSVPPPVHAAPTPLFENVEEAKKAAQAEAKKANDAKNAAQAEARKAAQAGLRTTNNNNNKQPPSGASRTMSAFRGSEHPQVEYPVDWRNANMTPMGTTASTSSKKSQSFWPTQDAFLNTSNKSHSKRKEVSDEKTTRKEEKGNEKMWKEKDEKGASTSRGNCYPLKRATETFVSPAVLSTPARSISESTNIVRPIPIRTRDDVEMERQWRLSMNVKGWAWPEKTENSSISRGPLRRTAQMRLNKRAIKGDLEETKVRQCLITRICFDMNWKNADQIELFILDTAPAFIVHDIGRNSRSLLLKNSQFTTVGNVVALRVGRSWNCWNVCDEEWTFVMKLPLPMREVILEPGKLKSLELIVTAKCLCPEGQDRHNDRHRRDNKGFIMLYDDIIHNICYYGTAIDAREHKDFDFQMVVAPKELLEGHAFWEATDLLWKIPRGPGIPTPLPPEQVPVELRETDIEDLFAIYEKLVKNQALMDALHKQTGTDYNGKFTYVMKIMRDGNAAGVRSRHKRELEANENVIISIVENLYSKQIFEANGEENMYELLVRTVGAIKAWRRHMNNR